MHRAISAVKSVLFPKTCAGCGRIIPEDDGLCCYCHEAIARCDPLKRCMQCGLDKSKCQCSNRVFSFDACIAPFKNTGIAKHAMYHFKYRRKITYGVMLAKQMALCVKNEYRNIKLDAVCYVPMHRRKQSERGFNQSEIMAKVIAELLGLPHLGALKCVKYVRSQHELPFKQRLENVKNMYSATRRLDGLRLLLVDDIKTTGATLNECAQTLLSAGAERVYCVTALVTVPEDKKLKKREAR